MIEDKKLKMKVAENPIEALWIKTIESTKTRIKMYEESLIVDKAFLAMCMVEQKKSIR